MRWLGIGMAAFGFVAAVANLALGTPSLLPLLVWGAVGVVGVVIIVTHPTSKDKT